MQFIHISDPHVDVLASHYGIDAARRFALAVVHAVARAPQAAFIAVTGDLTHNADELHTGSCSRRSPVLPVRLLSFRATTTIRM